VQERIAEELRLATELTKEQERLRIPERERLEKEHIAEDFTLITKLTKKQKR
jgi:hypothetical protein